MSFLIRHDQISGVVYSKLSNRVFHLGLEKKWQKNKTKQKHVSKLFIVIIVIPIFLDVKSSD